ncbi:unnamed protein product [Mytilus coruscus]|uniref:Potassium channel domain-containing protein n=1 Tax=Mytilus coruscus TaxID=42192 RepID=A0A6J8E2E1_MYTCO|nr:unnamed protein product [Mytilus coruscus]
MKCEVNVYIKRLLSITKSPPGIVFILCVYTLTSAAVYLHIENHKRDNNENGDINMILNKLISCNDSGNILQKQYGNVDDNMLNYWETLFFFVAMITTIGYGHITPQTVQGKVFVMTFSAIGIPLTAIIITGIGKRLSSFVTCLLIRRRCQERISLHRRDIQKGDKVHLFIETETYENIVVKEYDGSIIPLIISTAILIVYILIGSVVYSSLTHVSYMDAIYVVFLSISTISVSATLPSDSAYYIGSVIYILIGLTLLSMCVYAALQYNNVKPPTEPSERKENNANVEQ